MKLKFVFFMICLALLTACGGDEGDDTAASATPTVNNPEFDPNDNSENEPTLDATIPRPTATPTDAPPTAAPSATPPATTAAEATARAEATRVPAPSVEEVRLALQASFQSLDPVAINGLLCAGDSYTLPLDVPADATLSALPICELIEDALSCTVTVNITRADGQTVQQDIPFAYGVVDGQLCGELNPDTLQPLVEGD